MLSLQGRIPDETLTSPLFLRSAAMRSRAPVMCSIMLLLPGGHALHVGQPAFNGGTHRCAAPSLAAAADSTVEDGAVSSARAALLAEVAKDDRDLSVITASVATLEAAPPPKKVKKMLQGDWKLNFASDANAVVPFTTGAANGPFCVLEEVYHRMLASDSVQTIEVVRRIGPFGNTASSLCGRYSVDEGKSSKKKGDDDGAVAAPVLTWKSTFMLDDRGREIDAPKECRAGRTAVATHVSSELLVMRIGVGPAAPSFCVFSKMAKGDLKKDLNDVYSVYAADEQLAMS